MAPFIGNNPTIPMPHITTSLLDVAKTCRLGPLHLGMSRDDLRTLLGPTGNWGLGESEDRAVIWLYDEIEFYFGEGRLKMIFTDHGSLSSGGETLRIDPWIIRSDLPCEEFQAELQRLGIPYRVVCPYPLPEQRRVITDAGAIFAFIKDPDDPAKQGEDFLLFAWWVQPESEAGQELLFEFIP